MNPIYCVIMAGGKGERFWPCSREETPKQLLNIIGRETLIEQTILRLIPLTPLENILIVTNRRYVEKMRRLLPQLPPDNIIGEPCGRDTAPCVALAAGVIRKKAGHENAVMLLLPSDHCIHDAAGLRQDLKTCCAAASERNSLVTIGVKPSCPSADYGYIECGEPLQPHLFRVRRFVEKPTREKAEKLLAEGNFQWNSGMFVWKTGTVLDIMRRHAPDLAVLAQKLCDAWDTPEFESVLTEEYGRCRKISIDYAIMEKAENIEVLEASFDWDDIGNWTSLRNHFPADAAGNVAVGKFRALDTHNCIAFSHDAEHLLCAIDMDNVILVHTPDVTLVCARDSTPKIKQFLKQLNEEKEMKTYF